jgi:heme/copper-type cytochrome/quinol oxidase subunit 3
MTSGAVSELGRSPSAFQSGIPGPTPRQEATAFIGMVVFLASWAMLFASLFFAYGLVRNHATAWPPADQPRLPLLLPGLNTLVAVGASLALEQAGRAWQAGRHRVVAAGLALATALGAAFLVLQASVWTSLWQGGLRLDGGPYPSAFYALTGLHAAHVLVGLVALAWLTLRTWRGPLDPRRRTPLRLWTMYWHFVGAVWLILYAAVYVA